MKNLIKNIGKNGFVILVAAIAIMILFLSNSNAQQRPNTVIQVKSAIEGLYDLNSGAMTKDAVVKVYLRSAEKPFNVVDVARGNIDKSTMTGTFVFTKVKTGNYFIVLRSKNSIETWSKAGGEMIVNGAKVLFDFTNGKEKAYGDNMKYVGKHAEVFTGDVNQDGFVNGMDVSLVEKSMLNKVYGNVPEDLNGDEIVDELDYAIVFSNSIAGVRAITPLDGNNVPEAPIGRVTTLKLKVLVEGLYSPESNSMMKDPIVTVLLKDATLLSDEVEYQASGTISGKTYEGTFTFSNLLTGQYYIIVRSYNSIETWSRKGGETIFSGGIMDYDFTTGKDKAYGENLEHSGKFAQIYTGDVDQDGSVSKYDVERVFNDIDKVKGDVPTDLNGDGLVTMADHNIAHTNFLKNVHAITPIDNPGDGILKNPNITSLRIKAALEGYFSPAAMTRDFYATVYLRKINFPNKIVGFTYGSFDKTSFEGNFNFLNLVPGTYYIVIKSKNGIETWSKEGGFAIFAGEKLEYNFTLNESMAYGNNMCLTGKHASIYSGDVNQDGYVNELDLTMIKMDISKFIKGNVPSDLNGDEFVTFEDHNIAEKNFKKGVHAVTPYVIYPLINNPVSTKAFILNPNAPNPFNPSTQISFSVPNGSNVSLSIYDMRGREIAQLVNTFLGAGNYSYTWNASNFASGTYFYKLNVNGSEQVMKMQLIK